MVAEVLMYTYLLSHLILTLPSISPVVLLLLQTFSAQIHILCIIFIQISTGMMVSQLDYFHSSAMYFSFTSGSLSVHISRESHKSQTFFRSCKSVKYMCNCKEVYL